jgi:hypothetical protein
MAAFRRFFNARSGRWLRRHGEPSAQPTIAAGREDNMLNQTAEGLDRLPPDLKEIAEAMALAIVTAELKEDFLPPDEAGRIALEHRDGRTDDWNRATSAAISSLLALRHLGYALVRTEQAV